MTVDTLDARCPGRVADPRASPAWLAFCSVFGQNPNPERAMTDRPMDGTTFPEKKNAESVLGGADAVQKTTYVVGSGADPDTRRPVGADVRRDEGPPMAGAPGGTKRLATWATVAVLIMAAALPFLLCVNR